MSSLGTAEKEDTAEMDQSIPHPDSKVLEHPIPSFMS